uniref:Uncharacterized protein n=1 Tax=Triticum urartu TaxID=4572 RepID=A0A8R7R0P9_TRIUA
MHQRFNELLVSETAGVHDRGHLLSNVFYRNLSDPVQLCGEGNQAGEKWERVPPGGERPLGGAAEKKSGLGENRSRLLLTRSGGELVRAEHGTFERGLVVEGREGRKGEVGGDAGYEVTERDRGAGRGLGGLGEGEREAMRSRDEEGAGGGEGREEGGAGGGEVPGGGGFGHGEDLLGAGGREAELDGHGGDDVGGGGKLELAVGGLGEVADEGGGAEIELAVLGEGGRVVELGGAGVVLEAAGGADERARARVRRHRVLAAGPAPRTHRAGGRRGGQMPRAAA